MAPGTDAPVAAPQRVTDLAPDPRREGCVRVAVNGAVLCSVPAEVVRRLRLATGAALSPGLAQELGAAADAEAAFRTALRALARRPFARHDLARRLGLKGHTPGAVETAIARAVAAGLLDDAAFARQFVETRFARGRGPARLRRELQVMGLEDALIARALVEGIPSGGVGERAAQLARRRAAQLAAVAPQVRRRRVLAYLARRGFRGPEARRAVAEAVRGGAGPGPADA